MDLMGSELCQRGREMDPYCERRSSCETGGGPDRSMRAKPLVSIICCLEQHRAKSSRYYSAQGYSVVLMYGDVVFSVLLLFGCISQCYVN